jgi:2-methylcitrate dehydratase PrpD
MDSERSSLDVGTSDLGTRWEILDTGVTVKLYPSCAGTHPTLDAILDLRDQEGFTADEVDAIDVDVDSITPTVLIHDRPATGLEAKFSMPFCAAAAAVYGRVGIDTFDADVLDAPPMKRLMPLVTMRVDPAFDGSGPPLTQARVAIRLRDGRTVSRDAKGARGYPGRPASDDELGAKFISCARRTIPLASAEQALALLRMVDQIDDVRTLTALMQP